jgi:hypothetical protein
MRSSKESDADKRNEDRCLAELFCESVNGMKYFFIHSLYKSSSSYLSARKSHKKNMRI